MNMTGIVDGLVASYCPDDLIVTEILSPGDVLDAIVIMAGGRRNGSNGVEGVDPGKGVVWLFQVSPFLLRSVSSLIARQPVPWALAKLIDSPNSSSHAVFPLYHLKFSFPVLNPFPDFIHVIHFTSICSHGPEA